MIRFHNLIFTRIRKRKRYRLNDFTLDPRVLDRKDKLAEKPDSLVLNAVWAFTYTGSPSGLEVTKVELIPPVR